MHDNPFLILVLSGLHIYSLQKLWPKSLIFVCILFWLTATIVGFSYTFWTLSLKVTEGRNEYSEGFPEGSPREIPNEPNFFPNLDMCYDILYKQEGREASFGFEYRENINFLPLWLNSIKSSHFLLKLFF